MSRIIADVLVHASVCNYRIPEARETRGQTERFLVLFEKTSFADNDWRFSEGGNLDVEYLTLL